MFGIRVHFKPVSASECLVIDHNRLYYNHQSSSRGIFHFGVAFVQCVLVLVQRVRPLVINLDVIVGKDTMQWRGVWYKELSKMM